MQNYNNYLTALKNTICNFNLIRNKSKQNCQQNVQSREEKVYHPPTHHHQQQHHHHYLCRKLL